MINGLFTTISHCILHKVNAKPADDDYNEEENDLPAEQSYILSQSEISIDKEHHDLMRDFFLNAFKSKEYYNLSSETDTLSENPIYRCVSDIFDNHDNFRQQSEEIVKHMFDQSDDRTQIGYVFVLMFKDLEVDGCKTDAVGIFKMEKRTNFMKIYHNEESGFAIGYDEGVNLDKVERGCLIFNTEKEKGYLVAVSENLGRTAHYWIDNVLQATQRKDNYYQTQNTIALCKDFVTKLLPQEYEVTKADQASLMNKSKQYFEENTAFDIDSFTQEVLPDKQVADDFRHFTAQHSDEMELKINEGFQISEGAVKKQSRMFRSVIKLDKNFHVYVHGNSKFIEKGFDDEANMQYYRLFFREEE